MVGCVVLGYFLLFWVCFFGRGVRGGGYSRSIWFIWGFVFVFLVFLGFVILVFCSFFVFFWIVFRLEVFFSFFVFVKVLIFSDV